MVWEDLVRTLNESEILKLKQDQSFDIVNDTRRKTSHNWRMKMPRSAGTISAMRGSA